MTAQILEAVANGTAPLGRLRLPVAIVKDKTYSVLNDECSVQWKAITIPSPTYTVEISRATALGLIDRLSLVRKVHDAKLGDVYDTEDEAWKNKYKAYTISRDL